MLFVDCLPYIVWCGLRVSECAVNPFPHGVEDANRTCSLHSHYSGFGAGFPETLRPVVKTVYVQLNGTARRTRGDEGGRSASSSRALRRNGG